MAGLKKQFGQNVTRQRRALGMTHEELAEAVGKTIDTISNIERGIQGPRFDLLEDLAIVLECEVYELFLFDD